MIKAKKGNVRIKGHSKELMADFGTIVKAVYETFTENYHGDAERVKKLMRKVFEFAMLNDEEMKAELDRQTKEMLSDVADLLKNVADEKDEKEAAE